MTLPASAPDRAQGEAAGERVFRHDVLAAAAEDQVLVARIRDGDQSAFEVLFLRYYDLLTRFASAYIGSDRARDLVSDVFFALWRARTGLEVTCGVRAYLYGAVRNRAYNALGHARVARRHAETEAMRRAVSPDHTACGNDGEDAVAVGELMDVVRQTVATLPERCGQAFTLSRDHHLTTAEIAAVMGTTEKTVVNQLGKALAALRVALAPLLR